MLPLGAAASCAIRWRGRNQRPVITGRPSGYCSAVFPVGALIVREIPLVAEPITRVLRFTDFGPLLLIVVITVVNGVAEELFFRGALTTPLWAVPSGGGLDHPLRRRRVGQR